MGGNFASEEKKRPRPSDRVLTYAVSESRDLVLSIIHMDPVRASVVFASLFLIFPVFSNH
jgi:hypothetical protein